ncbi:Retrotransposon-derived protein PEG10 [Smittium mucronatum]|uniref:Retrotransposon-derived protein PEG10 n=1 Tax=Smittium mucronatum TaxID=133383 RepID=A0A1R0H4F6_9FUNG|nr:Retrotransposon-derived protein PEG10 [Smittium mucronatum]
MGLYFWARPEVFNDDRNIILYIEAHLTGSTTIWSVSTCATEFRTITRDSGFDQFALVDQFLRGLNDNVMNFMIMSDLPNELEGNVDIAIRIDNRLTSSTFLRHGNTEISPRDYPRTSQAASQYTPAAPEPNRNDSGSSIEIDAVTSIFQPPLSQQEKQRSRNQGICLYCGNPDHIADSCPEKASSGKG